MSKKKKRMRLASLFLAAAMTVTSVPMNAFAMEPEPQAKDGEDLIADFTFDDVQTGFVGAGAKAVENGNVSLADHGEGKAVYLDGSSYLRVTKEDGASLLTDCEELTISYDAKPDRTSTNWFFYAAPNETAQNYQQEHYLGIMEKDGTTTAERYHNTGSRPGNPSAATGSDWTHVDVVVEKDSTAVYVNGVQESLVSSSYSLADILGDSSILLVGKANWGSGEYCKGWIDNLQIRNRAMTEEEIAARDGITLNPIKGVTGEGLTVITSEEDMEARTMTVYASKANSTAQDWTAVSLDFELREGASIVEQQETYDLTQTVTLRIDFQEAETDWNLQVVSCNNPVLPGQFADPDIDVLDGKFYIYPTTDGVSGWGGYQFHAFSSTDLINWEDEGIIVDLKAEVSYKNDKGVDVAVVPWASGNAWAPSIEEKNGKYYFYFCGNNGNAKAIGVAVADSPAGPFTAKETPLLTIEDCRAAGISMGQVIDPSIYTEEDGTSYMLFGNGNAAIVQLGDDMMSWVPGTLRNYSGANGFREAITVNKRDGVYHFTWSQDDTGSENYQVNYGTSDSLFGPITYQYPILQKEKSKDILGTGHHSILTLPGLDGQDEYYIVYHRFWTPLGQVDSGFGYHRETCIDKLEYQDGLLQKATPTLEGVTEPVEVPNVVTASYRAGKGGSIEGLAHQRLTKGTDAQMVTAVPNEGYRFVQWSDGNTSASRTDTQVVYRLAVTAEFEREDSLGQAPLLAQYPLQSNADDISGNENHGAISGSVTWDDGLVLPGGKKTSAADASYVTLPEGMFDGRDEVTVSVWIKSNTNAGNYSALFFGTPAQSNNMPLNYWLFNPTNPSGMFKSVFTNSNNSSAPYNSEVGVTSASTAEYKGVWTHYTTVLTEDSITGYVNGVKIGTAAKAKTTAEFGTGLQAYIGRSNYLEDNTYAGSFQDLRIYDGAMDDQEVKGVYQDTSYVNSSIRKLLLNELAKELNISSQLDNGVIWEDGKELKLPTSISNAQVTWESSHPSVISQSGTVTVPDKTTKVVLTAILSAGEETLRQQYTVTVLGSADALDYWKEKLTIPYVVDGGSILPTQLGDTTITWSGEESVTADGKVQPTFTGKKEGTLKAVLKQGSQQTEKEFHAYILGTDAVYVESYTRTPASGYSAKLAYSMHLAYSESGEDAFLSLNDNTGVLFMRAVTNDDETLTAKSLKNPYLFYRKDGGFGVVATRVEQGGQTDSSAASSVMVYTTDDLRAYEEVGMLDLNTNLEVQDPVCEYDSAADVYRITWNDGNGNYYQNTVKELTAQAEASQPEAVGAPQVRRADTQISGAEEGNLLPLESSVGTKLKTKLSKLTNTGVEVPKQVVAESREDVESIQATALYNDGSAAKKNVDWNLDGVDFNKPGTYTVTGTVTQPAFQNESPMFWNRPDPQMTVYKGTYYFISTDENGQSRIYIRKSDTLEGIADSSESLILSGSSWTDLFTACLWAPELHVIGDDLYLFFSGSASNWKGVRSYVAKLKDGGDPTVAADWEKPVLVQDQDGNDLYPLESGITLDMTYFEVGGQSYVVWAQRQFSPVDTGSWLYIATVDKEQPWKLTSDRTCISKPDFGWDNNTSFVDEGPYAIITEDRLMLTFSGSGVDGTYCIGILEADPSSNLLESAAWTKGNYPILSAASVPGQDGPGHNSYVYGEDGNLYNVYHAKWNGGTRSASIRRVHFDVDGDPVLDLVEERDLLDAYKNVTMNVIVPGTQELVTVTYLAQEGGRIEGTAVQTIEKGTDTTQVKAVANEGYEFTGWSDGLTDAARSDKCVTEDATYTAQFVRKEGPAKETVTVEYTAGEGGKIEGTAVQIIEKGGSTTEVTAVANTGYTFSKWSDGVVTARRTDTGVTASKKVTAVFVKNTQTAQQPEALRVTLSKKKLTMGVKEKVTLKASVLPAGADQKVTWSSGNKKVATVNQKGRITGKRVGKAIITATTANGRKISCQVTVKKAPKKISLKTKTKTLKKGKTFRVKTVFNKKEKSYKLTYKSSKKSVATISANGKVKAKKKGKTVITVTTFNKKKAKMTITVR